VSFPPPPRGARPELRGCGGRSQREDFAVFSTCVAASASGGVQKELRDDAEPAAAAAASPGGKSSLGDAKSSRGDAESSLGDPESSLGGRRVVCDSKSKYRSAG
jgi:hypothetical protein